MRNEISRRDPHFCLITYAGSIDILRCFFSRKNPLAWLLIFSEKPMSPELNFDIPINHYIIFSTLKFLANEKFVSRGNDTVSWLRKSSFFSLPNFCTGRCQYLRSEKGSFTFLDGREWLTFWTERQHFVKAERVQDPEKNKISLQKQKPF